MFDLIYFAPSTHILAHRIQELKTTSHPLIAILCEILHNALWPKPTLVALPIWKWSQLLSELYNHSCLLTSYKDNPIQLLIHVLEVVFSGGWTVMHGDICCQGHCFWSRRRWNGLFPYFMTVLVTPNCAPGAVSWDGDFKLVDDWSSCQRHTGSVLERKFGWKRENTKRSTGWLKEAPAPLV